MWSGFSHRLNFGVLLLAVLAASCGSDPVAAPPTSSEVRVACFSNRCVQTLEALDVKNFKLFPAFEVSQAGPRGVKEFMPEIDSFAPTLLVVPNGKQKLFDGFSMPRIVLRQKTFGDLLADVQDLSVATGTQSSGEKVTGELRELWSSMDAVAGSDALWIGGAAELGGGFWNVAIDGTESQELLSKRFEQLLPQALDLTLDEVVAADPDVLVYTDAISAPSDPTSISEDPRWKELKAVRSNRVIVMPPSDNLGYGPEDYRQFFALTETIVK